jgi:hypothetical protein
MYIQKPLQNACSSQQIVLCRKWCSKKHNAVQTPINTDPEIGAQTNYAFEADENTTELKKSTIDCVNMYILSLF